MIQFDKWLTGNWRFWLHIYTVTYIFHGHRYILLSKDVRGPSIEIWDITWCSTRQSEMKLSLTKLSITWLVYVENVHRISFCEYVHSYSLRNISYVARERPCWIKKGVVYWYQATVRNTNTRDSLSYLVLLNLRKEVISRYKTQTHIEYNSPNLRNIYNIAYFFN